MNKYAQMADRLYDLNEQLERLEKENAELKEVHESDKRSLALIAKKGADFEKAYNEAKELQEEIAELKAQIEKMKCCQNCRKFNNLSYDCTCAKVCNEWEIKENDL